MTVDHCFELGKTLRPHGTKGELLIGLAVDKPEHYIKKESVFIEINKKLVPFFIKKLTLLQNSKAIHSKALKGLFYSAPVYVFPASALRLEHYEKM